MIKEWYMPPKKPTSIVGQLPMIPEQKADTYGAQRLGLDLVEYRTRQVIIAQNCRELATLGWKVGDTLYPKDHTQWVQYGAVILTGIARTPSEYGHTVWDALAPRIIRARLVDKPNSFIDCSVGFLTDKPPVKQEQQEC